VTESIEYSPRQFIADLDALGYRERDNTSEINWKCRLCEMQLGHIFKNRNDYAGDKWTPPMTFLMRQSMHNAISIVHVAERHAKEHKHEISKLRRLRIKPLNQPDFEFSA
jgi:hypothetical protein